MGKKVLKTEQVTARNMSATVRKLRIRKLLDPEVVKEVTHMQVVLFFFFFCKSLYAENVSGQYRDWPDGGIPSDRDDYKEFITYLLNLSRSLKEGDGGPVLVHWCVCYCLFVFLKLAFVQLWWQRPHWNHDCSIVGVEKD